MTAVELQRHEALIALAVAKANGAASGTSNTGYDVIVNGTLQIPSDGTLYTIASYNLTAVERAAYIEFQWLVRDPTTGNIAARRQGAAFQATGGVGVVDNPVPLNQTSRSHRRFSSRCSAPFSLRRFPCRSAT